MKWIDSIEINSKEELPKTITKIFEVKEIGCVYGIQGVKVSGVKNTREYVYKVTALFDDSLAESIKEGERK